MPEPPAPDLALAQLTAEEAVTPELRVALIECWTSVSNAGGAVGFPFPPVAASDVAPVADALIQGLRPDRCRLIIATDGDALGRRGIGVALMRRLHAIARAEMGLSQLHLAVRGGMGLAEFYDGWGGGRSDAGPERCGWPTATTATRC